MEILANSLKNSRMDAGLKMKEIAMRTGIDQALLSKFENGKRLPTEAHLLLLGGVYSLDVNELRKLWLADKVVDLVQYEASPTEIFALAESRMEYLRSSRTLEMPQLSAELEKKLKAIDHLRDEWQAKKPLNATQLQRMQEFFTIEYTFESNRIEGNTLTLQETSLVVNEGLTISGKTMKEHLEAVNHAEAVDFVMGLATNREELTRRNLLDLHALILKSIDRENAGRYRSVPVRISGSEHKPPQPFLSDKLMEDYLIHYRQQRAVMHPVILAAEMHERLVSIHPFIDGNGRTARLVMNLVLLRNGYTIANLKGDANSRLAYYHALEKVQVDNDSQVFYHLVSDVVIESLNAHLALV